jgi:carboxyl-terminal processing protease
MTTYNNKGYIIYLPIIFAVLLVIGIFTGSRLKIFDFQPTEFSGDGKLLTVLNYIRQEYVDSVSDNELTELAITEILSNLDPHSVYIPAKNLARFNEPLEGEYGGIGIQFSIQNDTINVVNTITGGPSEILGIKPGDKIIRINDTVVSGGKINDNDVVKKLKGKQGTKVKVSILRKNHTEPYNYTINRENIPLHTIDAAFLIRSNTGYIKISSFGKTTHDEFVKAINKLHKEGMTKLIIELRENGGGYLNATIDLVNEFLAKGKLIVFTKGKSRQRKDYYARTNGSCRNDKLIILIDEGTASASEIFAGAIQDNDRGLLIGRRSFGKGLVQEPTLFSDGSSLNLTVARYYTPTGRCIQKSYTKGNLDYFQDIRNRYLHGEFDKKDSINFKNLPKFKTPAGRIVYGGGGIMPDIFIPVDTAGISPYFLKISENGLIYQFSLVYSNNNRQILNLNKSVKRLSQFLEKNNILNQFVIYAELKGIKPDEKGISLSGEIIKTQLIAFIIRNIQNNDDGFYSIMENIDSTLQKAIEIFENKNSAITYAGIKI